ncbi:MAG: MOSC domain-containing protein [Acidimicrobiia bacterium]|nr:MOSC domain-containing protein [Acidimicrobiia bacterium]
MTDLSAPVHRTTAELDAGVDHIRQSPADQGELRLVVRRPSVDEREVLAEVQLDIEVGVVGDTWNQRGSKRTDDGGPHPDMQLNIMNARVIELLAPDPDRRALAGDQLYIDMDLSTANLPPGTRLAVGTAVIEVTAQPHTGCKKFTERFGLDAARWVNSEVGDELHLRGINAKVVQNGMVRTGDDVVKQVP